MASRKISRAKAEAALAAVKETFKSYLEPQTYEAFTDSTGKEWPERTYGPECTPPILVEDWNGPGWAICWEEGPSEWAYRATMGGTAEEDRVLVAAAAQGTGVDPQAAVGRIKPTEPTSWPKGVYAEPYYSFVLCL